MVGDKIYSDTAYILAVRAASNASLARQTKDIGNIVSAKLETEKKSMHPLIPNSTYRPAHVVIKASNPIGYNGASIPSVSASNQYVAGTRDRNLVSGINNNKIKKVL